MKIVKRIIIAIIIIAILSAFVGVGLLINDGYKMYKEAIENAPLAEKVETIKQKENYTKIEEMPQIYINAVLAVEDHRFYRHKGIDMISICRAVIRDIQEMSFVEGGSTITQQLAKNTYFYSGKKDNKKDCRSFYGIRNRKELSK